MQNRKLSPLTVEQIRDNVFLRFVDCAQPDMVSEIITDPLGQSPCFTIGMGDIWTIVIDQNGVAGGPGYWFEWTDRTSLDHVSAILVMLACAPDNQAAWEAATDMLAGNR